MLDYKKLSEDIQNKLFQLCSFYLTYYDKVKLCSNGNIILIKSNWLFNRKTVVHIADLLIEDLPNMMSLFRWNSLHLADLEYRKEILTILDNDFDPLTNISHVIDYLYEKSGEHSIVDLRNDLSERVKIIRKLSKITQQEVGFIRNPHKERVIKARYQQDLREVPIIDFSSYVSIYKRFIKAAAILCLIIALNQLPLETSSVAIFGNSFYNSS